MKYYHSARALRRAIENSGKTKAEIAAKLETTPQHITNICRGLAAVPKTMVRPLCKATGEKPTAFLNTYLLDKKVQYMDEVGMFGARNG